MRRWFVAAAGGVVLVIGLGGGAQAAPSCNLPKGKGPASWVERNLDYAEKNLPAKSAEIRALRSQVQSHGRKGEAFTAKAGPLERECGAIGRALPQFKIAREKWQADRKQLLAQIKQADEEFERVIVPKKNAIQRQRASNASLQCSIGKTFMLPKEKAAYERCLPLTASLNANIQAYNQARNALIAKRAQLVARLKSVDANYEKIRLPLKARYDKYQAGVKAYRGERSAWEGQLRQMSAKANGLIGEANRQRAEENRRRAAQQAQPRPGGELGKLSGPMAPGSSGRSPGSGPIPPGTTVTSDGKAKGQAKAASQTGGAGKISATGEGAAHQAGRVFDRGDVKVKVEGGSVVDARGVKPRPVPEAARRDPRWQAIERREKTFQAQQAEAQKKIEAIQSKIDKGEGNKGQLQVEMAKAKQQRSNAESNLNQTKYEKESFLIKLEEKPAPGAGGGK